MMSRAQQPGLKLGGTRQPDANHHVLTKKNFSPSVDIFSSTVKSFPILLLYYVAA